MAGPAVVVRRTATVVWWTTTVVWWATALRAPGRGRARPTRRAAAGGVAPSQHAARGGRSASSPGNAGTSRRRPATGVAAGRGRPGCAGGHRGARPAGEPVRVAGHDGRPAEAGRRAAGGRSVAVRRRPHDGAADLPRGGVRLVPVQRDQPGGGGRRDRPVERGRGGRRRDGRSHAQLCAHGGRGRAGTRRRCRVALRGRRWLAGG